MATNRPFANLDNLSKKVLPVIPPFNPKINQGQANAPVNTNFPSQLGLADRYKQPGLKTTNHLAQFFLSDTATNRDTNTKFRKTISLADRLAQPNVGTTNHLAQYFLSDVFTGYIKVKTPPKSVASSTNTVVIGKPSKAKTPQQQGGEEPSPISFLPMQGGQEPVAYKTNIEARQGILSVKGTLASSIAIISPTTAEVKTEQQGVRISGGQLFSSTIVQEPNQDFEQGGTIPTLADKKPKSQGGQKSTQSKSEKVVQKEQGISVKGSTLVSSLVPDQPVLKVDQGIIGAGSSQVSFISVASPTAQIDQGGTAPTPYNTMVFQGNGILPSLPTGEIASKSQVQSRQGKVTLDTLSFSLTGLSLRSSPTLYQGGESPSNELPGEGGHQIVDVRSAQVSKLLNPPAGTTTYTKTELTSGITAGGSLDKYNNVGDVSTTIMYTNVEPYAFQEQKRAAIDLLNEQDGNVDASDLIKLVVPDGKFAELTRQKNLSNKSSIEYVDGKSNDNIPIADGLASNDEATIIGLVKTAKSWATKDFRKGFNGTYKFYGDVTNYDQIVQNAAKTPYSDKVRPTSIISVAPVEADSTAVIFDAFIKSFSDGLSINYQDFKHIGQQDTFKVFTGTTRQMSLAFTAMAMPDSRDFRNSDMYAKEMLSKVNQLMTICGVGEVSGAYIKGPIIRIQIAGLVSRLICACTSVKIDVPIQENSWDIDEELPQMYDISLDLAVLAMDGDSLLTKKGKFYSKA